jgi:hypothetical protein
VNENTRHPDNQHFANQPMSVAGPADLLAYLPHTLGFQPRESFGFLTLRGNSIGATLRVDLPVAPVDRADYARSITQYLLADEAADAVLLFVYTTHTAEAAGGAHPPAKPYLIYVRAIEAELEQAGLRLRDGWLITDEGWRSYFCDDERCCPLRPLQDIRDSALNASLAQAGRNAQHDPGRNVIDPAFTGSQDAHAKITDAAERLEGTDPMNFTAKVMRSGRALWQEALGTDPDEGTACTLVSYLHCRTTRDRIMADAIDPDDNEDTYLQVLTGAYTGTPDWSRVEATEALLAKALTFTPRRDRAPLFCFLAWLCWYRGASSIAAAYLEKALDADPGHRLSHLMRELIRRGALPLAPQNAWTSHGGHRSPYR